MIQVSNLTKRYGEYLAVDNLSFTVEKGEILGFLGPNGAGKSTTMNMITGYISSTEGNVLVCGHDIYEEAEEAKKYIGYLPEIPPLYTDMTVFEYLSFVANLKKVKRQEIKEMLEKIMELTMISDVSKRLIKFLSKGYKQRVGLASALVGFPEVLILDEPTVGLDPAQITWVRDLIKELSKDHAIILSSHILSEISAICDKVIIINQGKLVASDSPENLINHMNQGNLLKLEVKGTKDSIEEALKSITRIHHIDYMKEEVDISEIYIYSDKEEDIREEVFYALSNEKCPILSMNTYQMTLEEIFLLVTKRNNQEQNQELFLQKEDIESRDKINDLEVNKELKEGNHASNI